MKKKEKKIVDTDESDSISRFVKKMYEYSKKKIRVTLVQRNIERD